MSDDGQVTEEGPVAEATSPAAQVARPAEPGELRPTGRPNARLRQTVRDMVISLAVVLGIIAVIMLITWRPTPDPVRVVDPTPVLTLARAQADYPVLYPAGLDATWRPTSARWEITESTEPEPAWHVGFVAPDEGYAQIGQTASDDPDYVAGQVGGAQPSGEWQGWQRYDGPDQRALVRVDAGVTVVVSGTSPWPTLEMLAERLSPTALPAPR